jgi:hypothetical protein
MRPAIQDALGVLNLVVVLAALALLVPVGYERKRWARLAAVLALDAIVGLVGFVCLLLANVVITSAAERASPSEPGWRLHPDSPLFTVQYVLLMGGVLALCAGLRAAAMARAPMFAAWLLLGGGALAIVAGVVVVGSG